MKGKQHKPAKTYDLINHPDVNFEKIRQADARRLAAQRFKRATISALKAASKLDGGDGIRVAPSLVFPPETTKPSFRVSLNPRRPYDFADDELPYKANKVWLKAQRQGNVVDMEQRVNFKDRDFDIWDFYLHPNGVIYDNPGQQTDLRAFKYSDTTVAKRKRRPIRYQDYEKVKVSIKTSDIVDDSLVSELMYRRHTLENPRHGIIFQYNPKTDTDVTTIHRLRPGRHPSIRHKRG